MQEIRNMPIGCGNDWKSLVGTDFLEYVDLRKSTGDDLHLIVSRYGASSINGGPLHVLRSKLRSYLHPYQPDQIAVFHYCIDKGVALFNGVRS
jgi:hypothetical protein